MAAPTYNIHGSTFSAANVASLTTASFTVSGSDRYMVAGAGSGASSPANVSAVKWGGSGGTDFTIEGSQQNIASNGRTSQWTLLAPSASTTTLFASWAANQDETPVGAIAVNGVDQTSPKGTQATASGTNTTPGVNATTAVDDFVIDSMFFLNTNCNSRTITVGAGQTSRVEVEGANLTCEGFGMSHEVATGVSTTMSWTISGAITGGWRTFALPLKPVSGGGGGVATWGPLLALRNNRLVDAVNT